MRKINLLFTLLSSLAVYAADWPLQGDDNDSIIYLQKESFCVVYNQTKLCPALVWWVTTGHDIVGTKRISGSYFVTDYSLPAPRAISNWFKRSGYQRGHLCPSADRKSSVDRMRTTFVMSNVAPMTPFLNKHPWYGAEEYGRKNARFCGASWSIAGCLWCTVDSFCSKVGMISVPDSFFRAVVCPKDSSHNVYWLMPAAAVLTDEKRYRVSRSKFMSSMKWYFHYYIKKW